MTDADVVREQVSHIARGCRASTSHNPAPYENEIAAALDRLEAQLDGARYDAKAFERNFLDSENRAEAAEQRVAFLVAEAHGWQPRLEASLARVAVLEARVPS